MKFLDEFREPRAAKGLLEALERTVTRPWTIMEICGGQTHAIVKAGIDELAPDDLTLVHGPGCPVCVTPARLIDKAIALSERPDVILCSFGDMLRVPGARRGDLLSAKARGADARIVYSPLDALQIAAEHPERQVVFFAVGFETTAPTTAMAVREARRRSLDNFSILSAHVRVPPALEAILSAPDNRVQGLLAAGHVCTVMGWAEYEPLAKRFGVPVVVTGFEPVDILQGLLLCVRQLERGVAEVENQYARSVRPDGNPEARRVMDEVFRPSTREWRGMGEIDEGGLALRGAYADLDAERRFDLSTICPQASSEENNECIAAWVLRGAKKPDECPAFGERCVPDHPLGAPMVSSEGACAAYFRYRKARTLR